MNTVAENEGSAQPGRKRVRFDESVSVADKPATNVPATVLSNVDDEDDELTAELQAGGRSLQGAEASLDGEGGEELSQSQLAAALRAQHRKELDSAGEGSILDDVAAAEAAYNEPDELITEDGIPIEPFNLRREREEGYFDADGNYIEYALKDDDDAWLASLAETVMGDILPEQPGGLTGGAAAPVDGGPDDEGQSEEQMRAWRSRLVDLLAPGETVLDALRRMAVKSSPERSLAAAEAGSPVAMEVDGSARKDRSRSKPRLHIPAAHRDVFNELTECSTLLLDNGDYNAHSHTREQLQRDLDQQQQQQQQQAAQEIDIFASQDDDDVQVSKAARKSQQPAPSTAAAPQQSANEAHPLAHQTQSGTAASVEAQPLAARLADTGAQPGISDRAHASNAAAETEAAGRSLADGSGQEPARPISESLQFDKRTGMYYDAELGCYWDGGQLFGDSASGQWYRFQDGQYQLVV